MAIRLAVKLHNVPTKKTCEAKEERALKLFASEEKVKDSQDASQVGIKSACDLFC
jgi:hypothetical protein